MRENLIVVRAGDSSLHPKWLISSQARNFDIFVSYYGDAPDQFKENADYFESIPGLKWPCLAQIFRKQSELLFAYRACWFPDDDILTDAQSVIRMFDLFHANDLWLAQPALGEGSHISHWITRAVPNTVLRFTDFVEIMCPIFNRHSLSLVGSSFSTSISGWGLDFLWPH